MTSVPQIITINELKNEYININKEVRTYLKLGKNDELFLNIGEEVTFSQNQTRNKLDYEKSRRVKIPQEI